jgi:hypothetical protein
VLKLLSRRDRFLFERAELRTGRWSSSHTGPALAAEWLLHLHEHRGLEHAHQERSGRVRIGLDAAAIGSSQRSESCGSPVSSGSSSRGAEAPWGGRCGSRSRVSPGGLFPDAARADVRMPEQVTPVGMRPCPRPRWCWPADSGGSLLGRCPFRRARVVLAASRLFPVIGPVGSVRPHGFRLARGRPGRERR